MYMKSMIEARKKGCKYFACDVIQGGIDKIVRANPLFAILTKFGIDKLIFKQRKASYESDTMKGTESFEQFYMNLDILVYSIYAYDAFQRWKEFFGYPSNQLWFNYIEKEDIFDKKKKDEKNVPETPRSNVVKSTLLVQAGILASVGVAIMYFYRNHTILK